MEIVIAIIFFIISAIVSIINQSKKRREEQNPPPQTQSQEPTNDIASQLKHFFSDIRSKFEGPRGNQPQTYSEWSRESEEDFNDRRAIPDESSLKAIAVEENDAKRFKKKKPIKVETDIDSTTTAPLLIEDKDLNQANLRKAIILSEILGKPLALRDP